MSDDSNPIEIRGPGLPGTAELLTRYLGPEFISKRQGRGGACFYYVEGQVVIDLLNVVFGYDGWTTKVDNFEVDYVERDNNSGRWSAGVAATVSIHLVVAARDGRKPACRADVGYGTAENQADRGAVMEKCRKEAVTDGIKRAARQFGRLLGNCLYSKEFLARVAKVKGPAERIEFDEKTLYRLPVNKRKRVMERMSVKQGKEEPVEDEFGYDDDIDKIMSNEELIL